MAEHLLNAERIAGARDVSKLDPAQRLVRHLLLSELARYRAAGRYPTQASFDAPTPAFIDEPARAARWRICSSSAENTRSSHASPPSGITRVRELADEPRLLAWLEAAGLTVEEAATIQPSFRLPARP